MGHVEGVASIINQLHLVRNNCTSEHAFALYFAVKHLFFFDSIKVGKRLLQKSIKAKMEPAGYSGVVWGRGSGLSGAVWGRRALNS